MTSQSHSSSPTGSSALTDRATPTPTDVTNPTPTDPTSPTDPTNPTPTTPLRSPTDRATPTERWQAVMQDNYGTPPMTLVSGTGSWVTDDTGQQYLDLLGGIAVNALGHAHPAVVAAVRAQIGTLGHTSNLAITLPALELCERLALIADPSGGARVFLCNSGAEANEAAFKLARLTGRTRMVAAANGFHGRTMGALALTGQPTKADPFRPLPGEVDFVPYGDVEALAQAVDETVAAVILEPIQGEAGVVVPPADYLAAARRITHDAGALLILDEVQTGIGRTGRWLAHQAPENGGIRPDLITLAKGLGGGLPIGAMIRLGHPNVPEFTPGSHGSTFGGNPISAAAALAVLDTITSEDLFTNATERGVQFRAGLSGVEGVIEVRGSGLLLGVVLADPIAKAVEAAARDAGVLVNAAAPNVIRLAPPLTISAGEVAHGIARIALAIESVRAQPNPALVMGAARAQPNPALVMGAAGGARTDPNPAHSAAGAPAGLGSPALWDPAAAALRGTARPGADAAPAGRSAHQPEGLR